MCIVYSAVEAKYNIHKAFCDVAPVRDVQWQIVCMCTFIANRCHAYCAFLNNIVWHGSRSRCLHIVCSCSNIANTEIDNGWHAYLKHSHYDRFLHLTSEVLCQIQNMAPVSDICTLITCLSVFKHREYRNREWLACVVETLSLRLCPSFY